MRDGQVQHARCPAQGWNDEQIVVTPHAKDVWKKKQEAAGEYEVVRSSAVVWFVCRQGFSRYRRVQSDTLECTCATFNQMRIPCRHLIAVLHVIGSTQSILSAFHSAYLTENFSLSYRGKSVELVVDSNLDPLSIEPPPFYKQVGRHKKRRIASAGDTRSAPTYKCRS